MTYLHPSMKRTRPIPKMSKKRRGGADVLAEIKVQKMSGQTCVPCEVCGHFYTKSRLDLHHKKKRRSARDDTPENTSLVCRGPGTLDCHGKIETATGPLREQYIREGFIVTNQQEVSHV